MPLPHTLIGAAAGYKGLADALGRVASDAAAASQSFQTVFSLTGPGSENLAEAEIQRRQHTRIGAVPSFATAFGLTGVGSQNVIEAEIMRRLFTRIEGLPGRTAFGLSGPGSENVTEAEIMRRFVTVTVKRV